VPGSFAGAGASRTIPLALWDRILTVDIPDLYLRSASYVDRVLKGEKPSDLPVQNPIKFQLIINLKTAKTDPLRTAPGKSTLMT
jgi:putative ABC transport system substrate-binding protein